MIDIISVPFVIKNKNIDSPFRLSILAAQRARQIIQATTSPTETKYEKACTIALEEVLEGKVVFVLGKQAIKAKREARRVKAEELKSWVRTAKDGELVTSLKQEESSYVAAAEVKELASA
ncbi:MAG: DNA-directed RNA polymerase subunit omega [Nitrospiria bacterium]